MSPLQFKIERMRRIFRGEEKFGEGKPAEQATNYRFDQMMDEIVEAAKKNTLESGDQIPEVDLLVSLSGFSPATTILAYNLLKPKEILVITSHEAEEGIDTIATHIIGPKKLNHRQFKQTKCVPTDPLGIYKIVKQEIMERKARTKEPVRAIIDITGGKKVMSATGALAAWQLDLPLCYIESKYDPELRQPVPGSEVLLLLKNPTTLFCDEEMKRANTLFNEGAFNAAKKAYEGLEERVQSPQLARFRKDLAGLYNAWCNLDLDTLAVCVADTGKRLNEPHLDLDHSTAQKIRTQLEFLEKVRTKDSHSLILCYFLLGEHYFRLKRHDFAALLYYRTIEACLKEHLEQSYPGFSTKTPDYSLLGNPDELENAYLEISRTINREYVVKSLPRPIGLMNAAGILYCLRNPFTGLAEIDTPERLKHLLKLAESRNQSVLAHGYQTITADQGKSLRHKALVIAGAFWKTYHNCEDLKDLCESLTFTRIGHE